MIATSSSNSHNHSNTKIKFRLLDRVYLALGFLRDGEKSVNGNEMLERTGGAADNSEWNFIQAHLAAIPLELKCFHLVTLGANNKPCAHWGGGHSWDEWYGLGDQWDKDGLVIIRYS